MAKATKLTKRQIMLACIEILSRYFPAESGKDTPELRKALQIPSSIPSNREWKVGACNWLGKNLALKG